MLTYAAPLRDIQFVLEEWLGIPGNPGERRFTELDRYQMLHIVEEAARFCSEVLLPLNASGDEEGCSRTESGVQTPRGFKAAYRAFVDAGWPALACEVTWGGQDLPLVLNAVLYEMLNAVNHAWTMYPGLAHGAYECLKAHGSAALKQRYLPKLVSGEWLATMCLTEPAAGSDVGLIRASARPAGDEDCYLVTADKIFISGGAHDLTENIVHLVLARLPGAPAGSKGLSLLLVPQILADSTHNRVRCTSIEKKMGLKGSATCSLTFDDALGWLIGEPHRGLPAMFVMMNSARLQVALQGLGHAEMAFQNAHRYANDRVQMRAPRRTATSAPADPISSHPAIRRSLGAQRAIVEGERMLGYWIAQLLDTAAGGDASAGQHATKLASLLTPVAKSFFTQNGFEVASDALQIFGGYGYIRETGIEQTVRDSRVSMIYEGTNEIQAIDLMQRKVLADGGRHDVGVGPNHCCRGRSERARPV